MYFNAMLVFDFDGVLINSLDEVALTSYNAATVSFLTSLDDLPEDRVQLFKRNRFHVQQIGDAIPLMNWCLKTHQSSSQKILSQKEYQSIIAGATVELYHRTKLIYETRKWFIEKDQKNWITLHRPYQPIWNELMRREDLPFVILTNKNRDATSLLCRHFGLHVGETEIYAGDNGVTKAENMREILKRFGSKPYYVIDDSVKNLQELDGQVNKEKKIISLLFAPWGYTGPEDINRARKCAYPVLHQTDFFPYFFRLL